VEIFLLISAIEGTVGPCLIVCLLFCIKQVKLHSRGAARERQGGERKREKTSFLFCISMLLFC
jgi:hypothetical protein